MSKSFTTAFETDAEQEVLVTFDYTPGTPETGRGYMACPYSYDPGSAPELYITKVCWPDGSRPGVLDPKLSAEEIQRFHDENDDGDWGDDDGPDWDRMRDAAIDDALTDRLS